ncbi:single-stranded DNA-binding protein [Nocardia sp. NPDC003482]
MSGNTVLTIIGNLTADPELKFTPAGDAVVNFTIAQTPRVFDRARSEWRDGEPLFLRCSLWRQPAENLAESLSKGARVIVSGRLKQRRYTTPEGENRTVTELDVDDVGPSLRYATATVTRNPTTGFNGAATTRRSTATGDGNGFGRADHSATPASGDLAAARAEDDPRVAPVLVGAGSGGFGSPGDEPGF